MSPLNTSHVIEQQQMNDAHTLPFLDDLVRHERKLVLFPRRRHRRVMLRTSPQILGLI